eukprot:jgi/Undpi1/5419/HiC_scaffold_2.g00700.m1
MFPSAKSEGSVWSDGAVSEGAASGGPSDGASDADGDNGDSDANGAGDGGGVDGDGDGGGGGGGGGDADGGDGDDGQGDGGGGGGDGGGGDGGDGDSGGTYKFPAFTPLSEERVKIVHDEIRQISHRAKEALEEVEIDADDIALGEIIGSGSFAEVRKGRLFRGVAERLGGVTDRESKTIATLKKRGERMWAGMPPVVEGGRGTEVAVKVLRDVRRQTLKRFWFEVLIMKDLDHPNIVHLLGATWRGRRLMMIVEYVPRGNLATVLEEGPKLTWKDQKYDMCVGIATGMAYLHRFRYFDELSNSMQNCVIHRDLKPQNILVTHDFNVKITDFGEATGKGDDAARTQVGTLLYIAPEIVRGDRYDERCDVYSFAVVLLAMLELREDVITLFGEEALRRDENRAGKRSVFTHMAITNSIVNDNLRPVLPVEVFQIVEGNMVVDDPDLDMEGIEYMDSEDFSGEGDSASFSDPSVAKSSTGVGSSWDEEDLSAVGDQARQPTYGSVGEVSAGNEAHGSWDLEHPRGRKRGKNYRPIKG